MRNGLLRRITCSHMVSVLVRKPNRSCMVVVRWWSNTVSVSRSKSHGFHMGPHGPSVSGRKSTSFYMVSVSGELSHCPAWPQYQGGSSHGSHMVSQFVAARLRRKPAAKRTFGIWWSHGLTWSLHMAMIWGGKYMGPKKVAELGKGSHVSHMMSPFAVQKRGVSKSSGLFGLVFTWSHMASASEK